ncbi:MCE family protein [Synechococcales cyanobacterium C]|uniref:MCE family protein n=1 Tax=Petrachloros mirabilis ULC683 TaxID=2781853 RepID=A0A8K1ZWL7_9CYAN|nr:MlaD family protein [Petrachloros mirabilis]NCJ05473.1 MCE family protein [Petrachloros mirabilis ULC683]
MQSRAVREGSVGLLILLGVGLFAGLFLWVRGLTLGGRTYTLKVEFEDALGLDVGSPVKFRGVRVGRVKRLRPSVNGVIAEAEITPSSLLIPRDTLVETSQSGFIGQVTLEFRPRTAVPTGDLAQNLTPFTPDCQPQLIFCHEDLITGAIGSNFDALIRSTTQIAGILAESDIISTANEALGNIGDAAGSINQLSRNANVTLRDISRLAQGVGGLTGDARVQLEKFGTAAESVTTAANQVGVLGDRVGTTADQLGDAAGQVSGLIADNRGTLTSTLQNMDAATAELKVAVQNLTPILSQVEQGQLIENLETLAANGAQASENLKNLTSTVNNPVTIFGLAQTLDSARVTFQNTQKITTDLEQITGSPEVRQNLIRLINGLSRLVSSSQELEQQIQVAKATPPAAAPAPSLSVTLLPQSSVIFNSTPQFSQPLTVEMQPQAFTFSKAERSWLWPVPTN